MKALSLAIEQKAPAADTSVSAPKSQPQEFAKQLEKATKTAAPTATKKPATDELPPAPPPTALQPQETALAQILASLAANVTPSFAAPTATTPTVAAPSSDDPVAIDALTSTNAAAMTATMTTMTAGLTATAAAVAANAVSAPEPKAQQTIMQQIVAVTQELAPEIQDSHSEPPLTPLEQAVHDMLSKVDHKSASAKPDVANVAMQLAPPTTIVTAATVSTEIKNTAPIAPMQQPQELVSQNHAHLVIDDPNGRVVMTVAIRGSEVNVSVRASDDTTAAALARNAGTLEEAMRGRGLQLAQFDSQRDLTREQREKPMYERKATVKKADGEQFTLIEETNS